MNVASRNAGREQAGTLTLPSPALRGRAGEDTGRSLLASWVAGASPR